MKPDDHFTRPERKSDGRNRLYAAVVIAASCALMMWAQNFLLFDANTVLAGAMVMQEQEIGMMEDVASETGTDLVA